MCSSCGLVLWMWIHRVNGQTMEEEENVGELQRHNGKLESLQSSGKTRNAKEMREEGAIERIGQETNEKGRVG